MRNSMMTAPAPSNLKQRIIAAIRGAFVADAASMGTHWIYDPTEMAKSIPDIDQPEFKDPPTPRFYSAKDFPGHYERVGMLSPYGEQMMFVTEYIATTAAADQDFHGEGMSKAMLEWATSFGGRPDSALNTFVKNMKGDDATKHWPHCGADDDQAHIFMKIVPVTCRYVGSPDLVEKVTQAIRVHQNNDKAIAFGITSARLLEAVLLGAPLKQALATVEKSLGDELNKLDSRDEVQQAYALARTEAESGKGLDDILLKLSHELMRDKPGSSSYNVAGRSCALPGSFIGPMALFHKASAAESSTEEAFAVALRENILASGDTCSRAIFIGAVLAAESGIPVSLVEKTDNEVMSRVDAAIDKIIGVQNLN